MIPSASQITARRWWARTCVRAAALLALLVAGMGGIGAAGGGSSDLNALMSQLSQFTGAGGAGVGGGSSGGGGGSGFGAAGGIASMVIGMGMSMLIPLGVAATLIWFERRIVRWLVPIPSHRCPRCEYSLIGVHEPRCPECGLPLDAGLVGTDDDASPRPAPPSLVPIRPSPAASPAAVAPASPPASPPVSRRRETRPADPE